MSSRRIALHIAATAAVALVASEFAGGTASAATTGQYSVSCQRGLLAAALGAPAVPAQTDSFQDTETQSTMPCSGSVSQSVTTTVLTPSQTTSSNASSTGAASLGDLTAAVTSDAQGSAAFTATSAASVTVGWSDALTVTGTGPAGTPVTLHLTLTL